MSHALKFSQDYQQNKNGSSGLTNKEVISRTMEEHLSLIDKPKSVGNIIYFTDDSWVVWTGNEWRVCEPSIKHENYEETSRRKLSVIAELKQRLADKAKREHSAFGTDSHSGSG